MFHFNKFSICSVLPLGNLLFSELLFISTLLKVLIFFFVEIKFSSISSTISPLSTLFVLFLFSSKELSSFISLSLGIFLLILLFLLFIFSCISPSFLTSKSVFKLLNLLPNISSLFFLLLYNLSEFTKSLYSSSSLLSLLILSFPYFY